VGLLPAIRFESHFVNKTTPDKAATSLPQDGFSYSRGQFEELVDIALS
jgi:hypothetical protein